VSSTRLIFHSSLFCMRLFLVSHPTMSVGVCVCRSGAASVEEMCTLPRITNMDLFIRPEVMKLLVEYMTGPDGRILYKDYVALFTQDDVFKAAGLGNVKEIREEAKRPRSAMSER
jgi:hypothetical protein